MSQNEQDYGYFGTGSTGYAHYNQAFNSTFPQGNSSASYSGYESGGGQSADLQHSTNKNTGNTPRRKRYDPVKDLKKTLKQLFIAICFDAVLIYIVHFLETL